MKLYGMVLTILFLALAVVPAWHCLKAVRMTRTQTDKKLRRAGVTKALLLAAAALMLVFSACFIQFRAPWLLAAVFLLGCTVMAYALGTGLRGHVDEHGNQ